MPQTATNRFPTAPRISTELQLKSVLVATDFAPTSDKAVRYAAAIARRYGSDFYLMHVVSALGFTIAGPEAEATARELALRDARCAEEQLAREGALGDLHNEVIIRTGEIWPEVEKVVRAKNIEMLVVGTHSRRGLGRMVLGSVAEQIFRQSSCPVLTVGPGSSERADEVISDLCRPILFATDFSRESLTALPYAISYANRRKTCLALLHMLPPAPQVDGSRWYTANDVVRMRKEEEDKTRCQLRELVSITKLEAEPMCIAQHGFPVEGIVETARSLHAVGIVLGLKPRSDAISHLPWSTAYEIVCEAACPVLTVRA